MKLKIINETGITNDTIFQLEDGTRLEFVKKATICMEARDSEVTVELEFCMIEVETYAEVTISKEHLTELALAHGYRLMRIETIVTWNELNGGDSR